MTMMRTKHVYVDNIQVQQILINLLRNAVEAVADTLVRIIVIATRFEHGSCSISISDSGPGIAKSMEAKLFEPFESSKADGTGIGLSISRTIAESHGGKLEYGPSQLGGACFTVTLPTEPQ
jgi:C4-dicarboxylate-specific signal transduction histidine kinase